MAVILNVTGPYTIAWAAAGSVPSSSVLGRTDNDDLFNIELEQKYTDVFTNEFGANPADAIHTGAIAYVNFTLVTFDFTQIQSMLQKCGFGSSGPKFPTVGGLSVGSTAGSEKLVALKVITSATSQGYLVDYCRLISHNIKDVGNKPTRAGFRFEILPVTAGRALYSVV